jgi:hypothetical protein
MAAGDDEELVEGVARSAPIARQTRSLERRALSGHVAEPRLAPVTTKIGGTTDACGGECS